MEALTPFAAAVGDQCGGHASDERASLHEDTVVLANEAIAPTCGGVERAMTVWIAISTEVFTRTIIDTVYP